MNRIVLTQGLTQRYGRTVVLRDVSLSLHSGVTVLLGPNGAGKTTLLETIATLRSPAGGSVEILGLAARRANLKQIRRRMGFLPQSLGYFKSFTAAEFVQYAAWLKALPSRRIAGYARDALDAVNLADRADSRLRTLSGGMLRRVGIAQAIVHKPDLIVLDEPTTGLDPSERIRFRQLARRLADHTCVLISTHVVTDVEHVADQIVVLNEGRVSFVGSPVDLEARARDGATGDTKLERAYSMVLTEGSGR